MLKLKNDDIICYMRNKIKYQKIQKLNENS